MCSPSQEGRPGLEGSSRISTNTPWGGSRLETSLQVLCCRWGPRLGIGKHGTHAVWQVKYKPLELPLKYIFQEKRLQTDVPTEDLKDVGVVISTYPYSSHSFGPLRKQMNLGDDSA